MNASRQPFVISAAICVILAGWLVARGLAGAGGQIQAATGQAQMSVWAIAAAAVVLVWTLVLVAQLTIKYGPQGGRNYLPQQIFIVAVGSSVSCGGR